MRTIEDTPLDRLKHTGPVDQDTYLRLQARKVFEVAEPVCYDGDVPRMVLQTLWRTPQEGGYEMKVAVTDQAIAVRRLGREAKPNPFMEVNLKTKVTVIQAFDDGKTRRIDLEEGDSLASTIDQIRKAAKTITRGVRVAVDGATKDDKKTAKSFRFELCDPITRTRKPKSDATASV